MSLQAWRAASEQSQLGFKPLFENTIQQVVQIVNVAAWGSLGGYLKQQVVHRAAIKGVYLTQPRLIWGSLTLLILHLQSLLATSPGYAAQFAYSI